jgi:hypothetical protein
MINPVGSINFAAFRSRSCALLCCVGLVMLAAGCAQTKVTDRQQLVTGPIPRPGIIWVYDFASTPADVPTSSDFAQQSYRPPLPQSADEIAIGHLVGAQVAEALVSAIRERGMPADHASSRTKPELNEIVLRGYFLSVEEGSAAKRMTIGFGSGSSHLTTVVEGYQMTAKGLRKLGVGTVNSGGNKTPGMALGAVTWIATANPAGLIVGGGMKVYGEASGSAKIEGRAKATAEEIADQLKIRFQEQGWVN